MNKLSATAVLAITPVLNSFDSLTFPKPELNETLEYISLEAGLLEDSPAHEGLSRMKKTLPVSSWKKQELAAAVGILHQTDQALDSLISDDYRSLFVRAAITKPQEQLDQRDREQLVREREMTKIADGLLKLAVYAGYSNHEIKSILAYALGCCEANFNSQQLRFEFFSPKAHGVFERKVKSDFNSKYVTQLSPEAIRAGYEKWESVPSHVQDVLVILEAAGSQFSLANGSTRPSKERNVISLTGFAEVEGLISVGYKPSQFVSDSGKKEAGKLKGKKLSSFDEASFKKEQAVEDYLDSSGYTWAESHIKRLSSDLSSRETSFEQLILKLRASMGIF